MEQDQREFHALPQPGELSEREKEDAMGAYLMMFASLAIGLPLPILNLVAAIIYYYINRSKGRFVQFHTLQSLISQIPVTLINAFGVFWTIKIFVFDGLLNDSYKGYLVMLGIANILYITYSIIGAVKARKGQMYYFWFFGQSAYISSFRIREEKKKEFRNEPPKL
ncbi:DUF4870 domain-containing protein [candidate division KSB1 bacterium]